MNREQLIGMCEKAIVNESKWRNRDTSSSIRGVGELWALLKAGCDYIIEGEDASTIYVEVSYKGFLYFDWTGSKENDTFYIPTYERLAEADGDDWY